MVLTVSQISEIRNLLSSDEIIDQSSPKYADEVKVWSFQKNLHPQLVLQPETLDSLQRTIAYLCDSTIDFAVRSGGVGSSSSEDVVISLTAFNKLKYDSESETAIIGAGQTWAEVDRKMEEATDGYVVLSARTPFVGVGGSILTGGVSWASQEFGLASDPQNLLDAHIVLAAGRSLWVSEEPDLLWALRGGGGNFGVVTAFKVKAYKYPSSIYSGMIAFPYSSLDALSKGVSQFTKRLGDPKMAMHVYVLDAQGRALKGLPSEADLSLFVYDANGEEHGRSTAGFKWALDIQGAIDMTKGGLSLREVNQLQAWTGQFMGAVNNDLVAALVQEIDPDFVTRVVRWFESLVKIDNNLGAATFGLVEIMQKPAFSSSSSANATAWPHQGHYHVLQLATGTAPGAGPSNEETLKLLEKAPSQIAPNHDPSNYTPMFLNKYHDLNKVFGANYPRLKQLKQQYDPLGRLNKGFFIS